MNLIEAIKSGHPFKRPTWLDFLTEKEVRTYVFRGYDVLAEDYYLKEQTIEISAEQFDAAIKQIKLDEVWDFEQYANEIKFHLGLIK